ncbi:MAG: type II toxin-antitoxin system Phd/YefM family antitoxin [Planctomycetaceae bacterium]
MTQVTVEEAQSRLSDLIAAAKRGEEVVITDAEQPVAWLVPMGSPKRRRAGSAKGLMTMADDFDAPLEDFKESRRCRTITAIRSTG